MKKSLGSLAALAALSLPCATKAQVVVSSFENVNFSNGDTVNLDLDGDGTFDFGIYADGNLSTITRLVDANGVQPSIFSLGETINFDNSLDTLDLGTSNNSFYVGVGFFGGDEDFHTGWIWLDFSNGSGSSGIAVSGAWEATPFASIEAGATAVPEPAETAAGVGLLGGLFAFLKRRRSAKPRP